MRQKTRAQHVGGLIEDKCVGRKKGVIPKEKTF